jgi:hypothetical protein
MILPCLDRNHFPSISGLACGPLAPIEVSS